ncbi:MAG: hypothetical protein B6U85_05910 [Desulfurococcales archaeon ex4484_42]|nr:MAG: hypothetical protein B6U85_05910 [Desulfurococcales archaeon ex4484_42]
MSKLYPIIWKELRDMIRDVRTLILIASLPLIVMPLMSISSIYMQQLQVSKVLIIDEDRSYAYIPFLGNISTKDIAMNISYLLKINGFEPKIIEEDDKAEYEEYDLLVKIPKGFIKNLTSFTLKAYVIIEKVVGSPRADIAESVINYVLSDLSRKVSKAKITYLAMLAKTKVTPESILEPLGIITTMVKPTGTPASPEEEFKVRLARLMAFSLIFVTTPSIAYINDSIVGEKERKTIEALLATPIPRYSLIIGKVFTASIVGLIAGLSDALSLMLFFVIPSMLYGFNILSYLTPNLIAIHVVAVYLSIFTSLTIITPIIIRSGSYRASHVASLTVVSLASIVFFMALYVDIDKLIPIARYALYAIPYTHAVLMIKNAVLGTITNVFIHALIITAISLALLLLAVKLFSDERIIYSKT